MTHTQDYGIHVITCMLYEEFLARYNKTLVVLQVDGKFVIS